MAPPRPFNVAEDIKSFICTAKKIGHQLEHNNFDVIWISASHFLLILELLCGS